MIEASLRILRADVSGMPIEWIGFEETVKLHCLEQILYPMGSSLYVVRGGINAKTGCRSTLEVHSIICTLGQSRAHLKRRPSYTQPHSTTILSLSQKLSAPPSRGSRPKSPKVASRRSMAASRRYTGSWDNWNFHVIGRRSSSDDEPAIDL
jgi:hypothetical protein